jgi:hypothetical protein
MPVQTVIKLRRDTAADWETVDPILAEGELGIETDTNRIKIGDGTTEWTGLRYGPPADELVIKVKNASGSAAIPAGTLVQFAGAAGDTVTATPAVTDGSVDFHYIIGVTSAEIAADGFGHVVLTGVVEGLNTSAYTAGDFLYSDPTSPGQLVTTQPAAPNFREPVAAVTRVGAGTSGRILVRIHLGDSINDLHDVALTSLSTGEVLQFDGTKWVNTTLDALPDQTGNSGKYLTTDGSDASWGEIDLSTKQDTITGAATTITSDNLTASRAVVSDGSGKVAASNVTSTEVGHLSGVTSGIQGQLNGKAATSHTHGIVDLTDFQVTSASAGQVLEFNGTKWTNANLAALPSQAGNAGRYLTTNGTTASWAILNSYVPGFGTADDFGSASFKIGSANFVWYYVGTSVSGNQSYTFSYPSGAEFGAQSVFAFGGPFRVTNVNIFGITVANMTSSTQFLTKILVVFEE